MQWSGLLLRTTYNILLRAGTTACLGYNLSLPLFNGAVIAKNHRWAQCSWVSLDEDLWMPRPADSPQRTLMSTFLVVYSLVHGYAPRFQVWNPLTNDSLSVVLSDDHNISTLRPCVISSTQGAKGAWSTATIVSARCEPCPLYIYPFRVNLYTRTRVDHSSTRHRGWFENDLVPPVWYSISHWRMLWRTLFTLSSWFPVSWGIFSSYSKMCWRSAIRRPCNIFSTDRDIVFQRQGTPSE